MSDSDDYNLDARDNLTRLLRLGRRKHARMDKRYSLVVRGLKLLLPLVALGIVVLVVSWPKMDDAIAPVPRENIIPQEAGRNELLAPRFESTDHAGHPYIITAMRAEQNTGDQDLVLLEKPVAEMTRESGEKFSGQADEGVYHQELQTLRLKGDVTLNHSNGYTLRSESLDIAMKAGTAETEDPVSVAGPDADLRAKGMKADNTNGFAVFKGPAKLILKRGIKGF